VKRRGTARQGDESYPSEGDKEGREEVLTSNTFFGRRKNMYVCMYVCFTEVHERSKQLDPVQ